ncbi:MAG: UDP-N-acetylmuramate dehydrogenase [Flavobacteriaceae bacterium]|nr:UDP-N-acetylmuramate dehydrogenase [Flavobacteriaceae bacterium]
MLVQENVSLKKLNTFGIESHARFFVEISHTEDLQEAMTDSRFTGLKHMILGGGSNVLFTQDWPGLLLLNRMEGIGTIGEDSKHVWIKAKAGTEWHNLVMHSVGNGWGGIENLSLIPGSCGAAPMQNIGAYGRELKDVFESLEAIDLQTGQLCIFDSTKCNFGYRESIFKREANGRYFISSITLKLNKQPDLNLSYGDIKMTLMEEMRISEPTVKDVSQAVIRIRQSKLPDPAELGNAGSFFKNPEIEQDVFEKLKEKHPLMPAYPATKQGHTKVAAGWLIEQCGLKGKRVGNCGIHARQALVLVNYGDAEGGEIWSLAQEVIAAVSDKFGISLSPEVNLV